MSGTSWPRSRLAGLLALALAASPVVARPLPGAGRDELTLVLAGGTLIDGTGAAPLRDAVVLLRGERIGCAGRRQECPIPEGVETLDLSGHWITPGLVDSHVHFSQTGWADGRPDFVDVRESHPYEEVIAELQGRPEPFFRSLLCSGVTAVFDVGGYPWTWELRARAELGSDAPHIAAAGPLLSTLDFWLNLIAERQFIYLADQTAARDGVAYLASRHSDAAKVWFIARQERDFEELAAVVRATGREAKRSGLPLIVHATGLREAKVAVEAGAHMLVHSVWDQPVDDELIASLHDRGTIYCPTLTVAEGYQRLAEAVLAGRVPEIDDPNGCVGSRTRRRLAATPGIPSDSFDPERNEERRQRVAERVRIASQNLARLAEAGIAIAMGTDAGNPLTLHGPSVYAEMEAMQAAGLSPMEVLVAATRNGARAMARERDLGTVEAGKLADLLVLSQDPAADVAAFRSLRWVMRGGVPWPVAALATSGD